MATRLGVMLASLRRQHKMTQIELAAKARISQSLVARLENGERTPSLPTLKKLARALEVEIGELLAGQHSRRQQTFVDMRVEQNVHAEAGLPTPPGFPGVRVQVLDLPWAPNKVAVVLGESAIVRLNRRQARQLRTALGEWLRRPSTK